MILFVASVGVDPRLPDATTFSVPSRVGESLAHFHGTRSIVNVAPDLARSVGVVEARAVKPFPIGRRLVALADRLAVGAADFEHVAAAIEFFNPDADDVEPELRSIENELRGCFSGEVGNLEGLDLGVAGLVMALGKVGTVPAASCRGHRVPTAWPVYPIVMAAADREHADWLQPLVEAARSSFEWDDERPELLCIVAPSISRTMGLAERILAEAAVGGLRIWPEPSISGLGMRESTSMPTSTEVRSEDRSGPMRRTAELERCLPPSNQQS
ncbi:hypothetical protein ACN28G_00480 [Micromonospora sp. WMMA1923]|uniref:hypothetical protein n=1 Tax=Micromonospora sp. WMMA1923 TaxID=3404125 RepID=UPI003B92F13C